MITKEEAILKLKEISLDGDTEAAHSDADSVLTDLLESLGCEEVVEAYHQIDKWYA